MISDKAPRRRHSCWIATALVALSGLTLEEGLGRSIAKAEGSPGYLTSRPRQPVAAPPPIQVGEEIRTGPAQRRRAVLPDGSIVDVNQNSRVKLDSDRQLDLATGEIVVEVAADNHRQGSPFVVKAPGREVTARQAKFAVQAGDAGGRVVIIRNQVSVSGLDQPLLAGQQLAPGSRKPSPAPNAAHLLQWTRDLVAAAESPLVPASPYAGGALVAIDPQGQEARLSLRKYHIDLFVEDGFARTTIDQTYFNHETSRLEGTFYFPLPADASLSRLAMYVDGVRREGGMVERDLGRQIYETILYRQRDPALLEWAEGNTFKMRVFPLEGRQDKRIILSYTQRLPSLYGQLQYRFPAGHSLQVVRDWSFHAQVKNAAGLGWTSASHALIPTRAGGDLVLDGAGRDVKLDRDLTLFLSEADAAEQTAEVARFSTAEQDGARYLMLRYRPLLPATLVAARQNQPAGIRNRKDWVFLFESSGDRDPLVARAQIELVRSLLASAEPDDTFAVLTAGTRVRSFAAALRPVTPENVRAAIAFLERAHLIGALDLGQALAAAGPFLKAGHNPYLVHLGSGIAAMGERRANVLANQIPEAAHYVGLAVGRRWDRSFMKTAAERTGGYFTQINPDEAISWRAIEVAAAVNLPRLLNIEVAAEHMPFLTYAGSLVQGEELCAIARLDGQRRTLPDSITITGTLAGQPFHRVLPVKDVTEHADYLPRTWAKLEIERLLAGDAVKNKQRIIDLSKAMYVMTPFTSLLVLENEDMYEQYKVDRGRQDHWALYDCPGEIPVVYEPLPGQPRDPRAGSSGGSRGGKLPASQVFQTIVVRSGPRLFSERNEEKAGRAPVSVNALPIVSQQFKPFGFINALGRTSFITGLTPREGFTSDLDNDGYLLGELSVINERAVGLTVNKPTFATWRETTAARKVYFRRRVDSVNEALGRTILRDPVQARDVIGGEPSFDNQTIFKMERAGSQRLFRELSGFDGGAVGQPTGSLMFGVGVESNRRVNELMNNSEDLRQIEYKWERIWFNDEPSHLTPERVHGGIAEGGGGTPDVQEQLAELNPSPNRASWLYQRPTSGDDDRIYYDLVAYAPGLDTNWADVQAILEAEAPPDPRATPGSIDPAARRLIDQARASSWQTLEIPDQPGRPGFQLLFDGAGRYAYERTLPIGLRERVVCDGQTLLHIYPDLGLAGRRAVTRFHRGDFAQVIPWAIPPAEDLSRGADLELVNDHMVAVIPRSNVAAAPGTESPKSRRSSQEQQPSTGASKSQPRPRESARREVSIRLHLLFAADGRLAERQIIEMPSSKVLYRQICGSDGSVKLLDATGKELASRNGKLQPASAPNLKPDTQGLVVLALPLRTPDHVRETLKIKDKGLGELRVAEALALFAAYVAKGEGSDALRVFKEALENRDFRPLGCYVLLAACGQNLDGEHVDVLAHHPDSPLAKYLALYTSPVLRKHASQLAANSGQWGDSVLQRLAMAHALGQRWQSIKEGGGSPAERRQALDFVRRNKDSGLGWSLLCLLQDKAGADRAFHGELAEAWRLFEDLPGLGYPARYEHARSLWKAGRRQPARQAFLDLYQATLQQNLLPPIDADFRLALLGDGSEADRWSKLLRQTAARFLDQKQRPAVLVLAWQCWQLDDQPRANHLFATAFDVTPSHPTFSPDGGGEGRVRGQERLGMTLAAIAYLRSTGQLAHADELLQKLLADPRLAGEPSLWRLAENLAEDRDQPARRFACLEQALDAEYGHLPEVIDLQAVRRDYERLLNHYQQLADAMLTLQVQPPPDFVARVVRTADRWRSLETDGTQACNIAAHILQRLGDGGAVPPGGAVPRGGAVPQRDLVWDYLTTPIGLQPNESGPWLGLAQNLRGKGDFDLADRAYRAAFEAEPTNAQILWDRAQSLRQAGRAVEAQKLFRQLAQGDWQPRFAWIQSQARALTGER